MSELPEGFSAQHHEAVPLWRDVRVLRWLFQIAVLIVIILLLAALTGNLVDNLRRLGLTLSFDFLTRPATFDISEGPEFNSNSPIWQAYLVGVSNTLRVSLLGIIIATLVGTLVGIARLSRNWLASRIAMVYVEIMQNTPLLLQLFFWLVLILALPRQRRDEILSIPPGPLYLGPVTIPQIAFFSQRSAALPAVERLESFSQWWPFILVALIAAAAAWFLRGKITERQGMPPTGQFLWAAGAFSGVLVLSWFAMPGPPLQILLPELKGTGAIANFETGWILTNNFQAILVGLSLYTAAFIAEVVRAGIQAVSHGQIEAATALSFTRTQQLRLIILPQAMRVIIPPLINQYLNLIKNSSLAIAVAFPDLFNISQTIGNKTGQNIQILLLVMTTYLVMSLIVSAIMNFVNRQIQIKER
jgi:general L-amino acid transport system permease protein